MESNDYYLPDHFCIIVASHISNPNRIPYLVECLESLLHQTIPVTVYLSISFAAKDLREAGLSALGRSFTPNMQSGGLVVLVRDQKTPQMRHIDLTLGAMKPTDEWILFCDDDDTYAPTRVAKFAELIVSCLRTKLGGGQMVAGAYETRFGKNHRDNRQEYWCYCVHRTVIERFYAGVRPYPLVLEDKCCDVLFGEFLRRLGPGYLFATLDEHGYNYRVENNSDSVTGVIRTNQSRYMNITMSNPPDIGDSAWADYVIEWNDYLHENLMVYIHDVYLRTLLGMSFEDILVAEFKGNRPILDFVDDCHSARLREHFDLVRRVCGEIYDIKI